jgi:hypothetical protein
MVKFVDGLALRSVSSTISTYYGSSVFKIFYLLLIFRPGELSKPLALG